MKKSNNSKKKLYDTYDGSPYGKPDKNYKIPEVDITIESVAVSASSRTLEWPKLPPDYKPGLQNKPDDFIVYHHTIPKKEWDTSGQCVDVLPELIGLPWNEITMCYVLSLNPTALRVSSDSVTADSCHGRITVMVKDLTEKIIEHIYMEVDIPCPENYCGYDLQLCLNKLRKGDKTPYKSIHDRQMESKDGSVQIGPGMWIGGFGDSFGKFPAIDPEEK